MSDFRFLLQPLGLLGLLGIPIIILIYLLKSKYVQKPVSSTFIWKRSLKYVKTRLPINFIFSLLLILQILTIIFASFALSRPQIPPIGTRDTVIILDSSASMNTMTEKGKTRYELALEEIEKQAGTANDNKKLTVISAGPTAKLVIDRSVDKADTVNALESGKFVCSDGLADVEAALELVLSVKEVNPDAKVYFYTDKEYFDVDGVEIKNFASETDENIGITSFTDSLVTGSKYSFNAIINYYNPIAEESEEPITKEVNISLHIDGSIVSTQKVILNSGKNIVTLATKQSMVADNAIFYQISGISEYESAKITLDGLEESDGLLTDNERTVYAADSNKVKILVVSENATILKGEDGQTVADATRTTFLVTALRNIGYTLSNKTDIKQEISQVANLEGYNLYIFEGVMPEVLPTDGAVWFINPKTDPVGTSLRITSPFTATQGVTYQMIPAVSSETETYKTLVKNIGKFSANRKIVMGQFRGLSVELGANGKPVENDSYEEIFTCDNKAVVMAGRKDNVRIVCLSFDLNKTNLPMLIDFPLLVNNMITYSLPDTVEKRSYDVGETVKFNVPVGTESYEFRYHDEKSGEIRTLNAITKGENDGYLEDSEFTLDKLGVYSILVKYANESEKIIYLPTSVPADESDILAMGDSVIAPKIENVVEDTEKAPMEIWPYIVMVLLVVLVVEWGVYYRDEF